MVSGLVICHGNLAFEFVNAVKGILGHAEALYPFTNENLSPETLYQHLLEFIRSHQMEDIIVMADLRGGSCWAVGKMLSREFPRIKVISGVNLPMLVSFLTKRDSVKIEELPAVLEQDSLRGIVLD
ncbi:MAG: hypothetical protein D6748_12160 [Calditrichaeota bacterium]|nr:MAG: hypothetical protein D6748_12160 [Calditrichota bacterium]